VSCFGSHPVLIDKYDKSENADQPNQETIGMTFDYAFDLSPGEFLSLPHEVLSKLTGAGSFVKSRPFNPHLTTEGRAFNAWLHGVAREIEETEGRRKRSFDDADRFRAALRALVLDLYSASTADPALQVGVPLNANVYGESRRTRYSNSLLTYRPTKAAFYGLERLGLLQIVKRGWHEKSKGGATTKVTATGRLVAILEDEGRLRHTPVQVSRNVEVIILHSPKSDGARVIEYDDNDETNQMRDDLRFINSFIAENGIDLEITSDELENIQRRLHEKAAKRLLEFSRTSLFRIFNNGVFSQGGRFYGGWWQEIPHEYRCRITINGEPTVEADYSGFHPRLLYARVGRDCPGDPYSVGLDPRHREWVKLAFQTLINAPNGRMRKPGGYNPADVGFDYKELRSRVAQHHEPIAQFFSSGAGIELQFVESCIAERVMLDLAREGIVCLPVHDSFLVQQRYQDKLIETMHSAYEMVVGRALSGDVPERLIKIKEPDLVSINKISEEEPIS